MSDLGDNTEEPQSDSGDSHMIRYATMGVTLSKAKGKAE